MSEATQRDTPEMKRWYAGHRTRTSLGFDPDGMCQKICRTARNIGPGAPSALASALMTPQRYRIEKLSDIVVGDVMYFDDPKDNNPSGHVVTVMALDRTADPNKLESKFVDTNSVKADSIVRVRADYFLKHWGDSFQWGGRWLNGEPFYDLLEDSTPKPKTPLPKWKRIEQAIENLETTNDLLKESIETHQKLGHTRYVRALQRDRVELIKTLQRLKKAYNNARKA